MIIALSARYKLCFDDGTLTTPESSDPKFKVWTRCNNPVISWILASLQPSIASSVLYFKTAKDILIDLEERFSQSSGPQLYSV